MAHPVAALIDGFFDGKDIADRWKDRTRTQRRQDEVDGRNAEAHRLNMDIARSSEGRAGEAHDMNMTVTGSQNNRAEESHGLNMRIGTNAEQERETQRRRDAADQQRQDRLQAEEAELLRELFPDNVPVTPITPTPATTAPPTQGRQPAPQTPTLPRDPRSLTTAVTPVAPIPAAPPTLPADPQTPTLAPRPRLSGLPATSNAEERRKAYRADLAAQALQAGVAPDGTPLTEETRRNLTAIINEADSGGGSRSSGTKASETAPRSIDQAIGQQPNNGVTARDGMATMGADMRTIPNSTGQDAPVNYPPSNQPRNLSDTIAQPQAPATDTPPVMAQAAIPSVSTTPSIEQSMAAMGVDLRTVPNGATRSLSVDVMQPRNPATGPYSTSAAIPEVQQAPDAARTATPLVAPTDAASATPANETIPNPQIGTQPSMSQPQIDRGRQALAQHVAGPDRERLVNFYMRNGMADKAQAIDAYFQREETARAMDTWTDAVFAVQLGDDARAEAALAQHYNTNYDDGYQVINDGRIFRRDNEGNIVGAEIEFRNIQTGETFTRSFDNVTDFYSEAIQALSPAAIFEHQWAEHQSALQRRSQMQQAAQDMQLAANQPNPQEYTDRLLDMADKLSDLDVVKQGAEVYLQQAASILAAEGQTTGATGDVPRYRP